MKIKNITLYITVLLASWALLACGEYGKVDQGRVIAFENDQVTVIEDKNMDPLDPDYSILPPHTYSMPTIANERGANPAAGLRLKIDVDQKYIKIFNINTQSIEDLDIEILDVQKDLAPEHPLVTSKDFPVIDKLKNAITIYSPRQRLLVTFVVPSEYIDWSPNTWEAGDEVRIYWKDKGQALRFMNITKTDIYKR